MNEKRSNELAALLQGGLHLLDQARAGEWERLAELQKEHHQRIVEFFTKPVTDDEATFVSTAVRKMLELNAQIADLGAKARDNCLQEAGSQNHRRQAIRKYTEHKR